MRIAKGRRIGRNAGSSCERPNVSGFGSISPVTAIALVAMRRPTSSAPASPMKSFAGCQLNGRKPRHAPMRIALMRDARLKRSVWPVAVSESRKL
ncbi:hypothetical protein CMMCAS02_06235 [Clavibacter michiganensis subsp. michiganensis]|nr:hypothetical protein CMMCAS02_06235 [Clavibacter michiganensis subsp. michiganensis]